MPRRKISQKLRALVSQRANFCCEYCCAQSRYNGPFSVEHVTPLTKAGTDDFSNLALACQYCNNYKYTKTHATDPLTQTSVSLYNPRRHEWANHFAWSEDYSEVVGITAIGRATILSLRLNRVELVNIRQALARLDEHPPKF